MCVLQRFLAPAHIMVPRGHVLAFDRLPMPPPDHIASFQQSMAPMPNPEWYEEKKDTIVTFKNLRYSQWFSFREGSGGGPLDH